MSHNYTENVNQNKVITSQNEAARGDQRRNNAGGYTFTLDKWARLDRFVVLGTEGNTFYVSQKDLTQQNFLVIQECIAEDGKRVVETALKISDEGRAIKNAAAVFTLALCAAHGDNVTKQAAFRAMPKVARTATDFFSFLNQYKALGGGFGIVARKGIQTWYQNKDIDSQAYQIVKYQQRNGWSHLDALRLSHVKPRDINESNLYAFAKAQAGKDSEYDIAILPTIAQGFLKAKNATASSKIVSLIKDYNLPREAIPTEFLNDVAVWEALLEKMPATALIRNLGKMTSIGLIKANSNATKLVVSKLSDSEWLRKSRLHPITILNAMSVYKSGHGVMGSLHWNANGKVIDALDNAFYGAFDNIEPTGKFFNLALDVSGSMSFYNVPGMSLSPREVTAAMAMATARVEKDYVVTAFSHGIKELNISPKMRLNDVMVEISELPFSSTDCAQPMLWAHAENVDIDVFVVYTDNETWSGRVHPFQALKQYRKAKNSDAKLVVCATLPSEFSIADPNDAGMMDIVGFDSSVPNAITEFTRM